MKRLRLYALGTTVVMLAALALAGGTYFRAAPPRRQPEETIRTC